MDRCLTAISLPTIRLRRAGLAMTAAHDRGTSDALDVADCGERAV